MAVRSPRQINRSVRLLTPVEAAERLSIHVRTVKRLCNDGLLAGVRIPTANGGYKWQIESASVDAMRAQAGAHTKHRPWKKETVR